MAEPKTVAVAGASGLAGAHIVREALARGYQVRGVMRDKDAPTKAPYLMALPGAKERLTLFSADMHDAGAFDAALAGVDGVFIACLIPVYAGPDGKPAREMDDAEGDAQIIQPTVDGCLNIMGSAAKGGARTVVICSSTSSTNPVPSVPVKNEIDHWSDADEQRRAKKYTSATKTVMEKAAINFAAAHDMRLAILLPTGMFGPVVLPEQLDGNPHAWLLEAMRTGAPRHETTPNDSTSLIHLHDLAALFLAAYENPDASGRYFGVRESWPWRDIYAALGPLIPEMRAPAPLEGAPNPATGFDFTRRDSLGVEVRDIPTTLRQTVEWLRSDPFAT